MAEILRKVEKFNVDELVNLQEFQIQTAREVLAEEQLKGFPKAGYITLVDNKETDDLKRLKRYGNISYFAPQQLQKVVIDALDLLIKYSPVGRGYAANRTGRYLEHHVVILNGQVLTGEGSLIKALDKSSLRNFGADEIYIVNVQPYARKIERGHSTQAPKGVYKRVTNMLRRKYSKIAFISHRYIGAASIPGLKSYTVTARTHTKGGAAKQVAQTYPAIRIKRGRGLNG